MTRIKALLQGREEQPGYAHRTHRSKKNRNPNAFKKAKAVLLFKKKRQERKEALVTRRQEYG